MRQRLTALQEIENRYNKLAQMMDFSQETLLEFKPKYIQLGSNYFMQRNQHETGLKLVH
jgi:hypothetical protein